MIAQFETDAEEIIRRLQREGVQALYHFTSIENLPLIRDMGGLRSKQALEEAGLWPPPEPGGNALSHSLDRSEGNWDKLSLNFTPNTPMAYWRKRQSHLCFFVLKPDIATWPGVLFTNTNAAAGNQERESGGRGLDLVDFGAVRSTPRPRDREGWVRPVQAEILVPGQIDIGSVLEVTFVSQASMEEGDRLWGNTPHPSFRIEPRHFADLPHLTKPSMGFPHVVTVLLTDEQVNTDNYRPSRIHKATFDKRSSRQVTALLNVRALAGTRATVTWSPGGDQNSTEFETSADYWHWPSIASTELPSGLCLMEYRLNDVRWVTLRFEVRP